MTKRELAEAMKAEQENRRFPDDNDPTIEDPTWA